MEPLPNQQKLKYQVVVSSFVAGSQNENVHHSMRLMVIGMQFEKYVGECVSVIRSTPSMGDAHESSRVHGQLHQQLITKYKQVISTLH